MNDVLKVIISLIFSIIVLVGISGYISDNNMDFGIATVFIAIIIFAVPFVISMAVLEHLSQPSNIKEEKIMPTNKPITSNAKNLKFQGDTKQKLEEEFEDEEYEGEELSEKQFLNDLRYGDGSPGNSTRFITNLYLNKIKEGENSIEAKADLIKQRYSIYSKLGHQISNDDIDNTIIIYANESLAELILLFNFYESLNEENTAEYFQVRNLIFRVIIEESNKLLPENERLYLEEQKIRDITMQMFVFVMTQKK